MDITAVDCLSWYADSGKNPVTGRKIKRYGPTFRKVSQECDKHISCKKLNVLENVGLSCYMDSVLVALFAAPNDFTEKKILYQKFPKKLHPRYYICSKNPERDRMRRENLQTTLRFFTRSLRTAGQSKKNKYRMQTCKLIRKYIEPCNPPQAFHQPGEQEAGEFLVWLFSVFGLDRAKRIRTTYLTDSEAFNPPKKKIVRSSRKTFKWSSPIVHISGFKLEKYLGEKNVSLKNFIVLREDSGILDEHNLIKGRGRKKYKRRIEYDELIDSPYLVFWLDRSQRIYTAEGDIDIIIDTDICPPRSITLPSGRKFKFNAVVCHHGQVNSGHYVAYVKCRGKWYYYNDIGSIFRKVGNYDALIKKSDVRKKGTLYFYVPADAI